LVAAIHLSVGACYLSERAAAGGIAVIAAIGGALTPLMLGWIRARTGDLSLGLQVSGALVALSSVILLVGLPARVLRERSCE
jgi:MFS transporter, ACS family, phthalate transporter